ncbi:MAG: hypothetical protein ACF8PN_08185 [Phycisphaerales bacterium]
MATMNGEPKITAKTGNAPIKPLGQTRGTRFGTDRDAQVKGGSQVTGEPTTDG